MPFSSHVACTMEMVNMNKDYDVAVIDEIQMIADPGRGHSWTRALLGLRGGSNGHILSVNVGVTVIS